MKKKRWYIQRVRLNRDGYDRYGSYWGTGTPLWYCYSADGDLDFHIRGHRDYAKCAYSWVRNTSNPERAARHVDATGRCNW